MKVKKVTLVVSENDIGNSLRKIFDARFSVGDSPILDFHSQPLRITVERISHEELKKEGPQHPWQKYRNPDRCFAVYNAIEDIVCEKSDEDDMFKYVSKFLEHVSYTSMGFSVITEEMVKDAITNYRKGTKIEDWRKMYS